LTRTAIAAAALALGLVFSQPPAIASDISSWSDTAGGNNAAPPNGWPSATMLPNEVAPAAREMMAATKRWFNAANPTVTAAGTADALTATLGLSSLPAGQMIAINAAAANATTAPTLTITLSGGGTVAGTITKAGGAALVAGDIRAAGHRLQLVYTGAGFELLNPATIGGDPSQMAVTATGGTTSQKFAARFSNPIDIRDRGVKCDGTDDAPAINAALAGAAAFTWFVFPADSACYVGASIQIPVKTGLSLTGAGSESTVLFTDQNIPIIKAGTYAYAGANDFSYPTHAVYGLNIRGLRLENTSATKTATAGIELRGVGRGTISGVNCTNLKDCLVVYPISGWNVIDNINIVGTGAENAVLVKGDGYNSGYNSTGNMYSNIRGQSVKTSLIQFTGCTFGDAVAANIIGTGIMSGGNGAAGGAIAGVYMNSNGANCTDGLTRYAHKIALSNIDMDGVSDYVVRGTNTSIIDVGPTNKGGNVVNGISFNAASRDIDTQRSGFLTFSTGATPMTDARAYIGNGNSGTTGFNGSPHVLPYKVHVQDLFCWIPTAPGAGITYTFNLSVDGTDNAALQVSGTNAMAYNLTSNDLIVIPAFSKITIHRAVGTLIPDTQVNCSLKYIKA